MRKYKGFIICPWPGPFGATPDRGEPKYFVEMVHEKTGRPFAPEHCPKAWSLREAREKINAMHQ